MSEDQAPYGPSPLRHLRLVKPKMSKIVKPKYRKLYELVIKQRVKELKLKYLKSLQKQQAKSKGSETLTDPSRDNG